MAVKEFQKYHTKIMEDTMRDIELKNGVLQGAGGAAATSEELERV